MLKLNWFNDGGAVIIKRLLLIFAAIGSIGVGLIVWGASAKPGVSPIGTIAVLKTSQGNVHGSVVAQFKSQTIVLTDFPVFLKEARTGIASAPETTDRSGHYFFRNQPDGDYMLCWSPPGWVAGCNDHLIKIRGNISFVGSQLVTPLSDRIGTPMWGNVTLADGSSPWFNDAYFKVKQEVQVTLRNSSNVVVGSAYTNSSGQFVIPYVPNSSGSLQATATAGGGSITVGTIVGSSPLSLQLRNKRPAIVGISTQIAAQQRREVPVDAILDVTADVQDPDGNTVKISWLPAPDNGSIASTTGATNTWKLPGRKGIMVLYILADDGNGGIATYSTAVTAGAEEANFGITLVDLITNNPVTKATVTVNGDKAKLLPSGMFFGAGKATNRYVVNVTAPGYVFVSKIYDHGDISHQIKLAPAALSGNLDPKTDITLVDTRKNLRDYGYVESVRASIHFSPNTLVGSTNQSPVGSLDGEIGAINISSEQMPGDNGALRGGKDVGLISYGAMYTELRDATGDRMHLAAGAAADVIIPVPFQMTNPPATVPMWYYDEQSGFWELFKDPAKYDANQHAYIGKVTHLSAFNIDLDQADLACFRVLLDNVQTGQLQARVTPVTGQTFPDSGWFDIHDQLNVIKRLPPNSTVHIALQKDDGTPEPTLLLLDEHQVISATGEFATGPATLPHFPDAPYTNCKTVSVRTGLAVPAGINSIEFLQRYSGTGSQSVTQDYYLHIDSGMTHPGADYVGGDHSTLGAWWNLAGFNIVIPDKPNSAADEAHQGYLNFNDLGFGRDMHIREDGAGHVYAYVTNYNRTGVIVPDQNPLNAVYADNQDQTKVVATVAMEATDFGGMTKVIKFFVYAGDTASSKLVDSANLDGLGQKFVPQLCQVCHGGKPFFGGGTPSTLDYALRTTAGVKGAVMREFDLASLLFPGDTIPGNVAGLSATRMTQFFNLNQHVLTSGVQPEMVTLINGFNPNAATFHSDFVPAGSGWDDAGTKQDMYVNVVGKSCRTCHIAFDPTSGLSSLNWQSYSVFTAARGQIGSAVCSNFKIMPHALMTFRNFWLGTLGGPYEPAKLAAFNTPEWAPLGSCN